MRILAIDDDLSSLEFLRDVLGSEHDVTTCGGGREGLEALDRATFDLVLVDLCMPESDGFEVLRILQSMSPPPQAIVLTATDTARQAVEALRLGARDYLIKPTPPEEIRDAVVRAACGVLWPSEESEEFGLIGRSPGMRLVHRLVPLLARSHETVLVLGETGSGKELLAQALRSQSPQRTGPFVAHNMAATPTELTESLFFGHVRGAFSGAIMDHVGVFEQASGGILFLDEVDSFPLALQAKLLRVLESRTVQRVGSTGERPTDVRVIAASSVDLGQLVARGLFRADLYYRLRQLEVTLPPLRERREDIPLLAEHFLAEFAPESERRAHLGPAALKVIRAHSWPGNVRELRHAVRSAALLAGDGIILPGHLPRDIATPSESAAAPSATLADVERVHIQRVLESVKGNQRLAARLLGIDRGTLARKLRQFPFE